MSDNEYEGFFERILCSESKEMSFEDWVVKFEKESERLDKIR